MGFSEAGNHGKPWFSRLPDQLLKKTAVTFGWRLFSGSSFAVLEARCRASGFERIGPLGGRDGFAFGEPLQPRCPWTDNNVILRRVLVFAGCGQSMKYVFISLPSPDALLSALFTCPSAACSALHRTLSVRHPGLWPGISGSRAGGSFCRSTCWWAVLSGRFL